MPHSAEETIRQYSSKVCLHPFLRFLTSISLNQVLVCGLICGSIAIFDLCRALAPEDNTNSTTQRGELLGTQQPEVSGAAIRAPVRCDLRRSRSATSCGEDISLSKAKASYSREVKSGSSRLQVLTNYNVCNEAKTQGLFYYWAPAELYSDGKSQLEMLKSRACDGVPVTSIDTALTYGGGSYVIVESDQSTASEQHLALCKVSIVSEAVGPPSQCVTVAIMTPTETWLRGADLAEIDCKSKNSKYTTRNSGAIDIEFDVTTKMNPLELSAALMSTLKTDFELSVEEEVRKFEGKVTSVVLRSAGSLRNSKILPRGWRETLDFDVWIFPSKNAIAVHGVAHALVCRQALGSLVNYTGPDDSQRSKYASALDSGVNAAIRSGCKNYRQQDAGRIICNQ